MKNIEKYIIVILIFIAVGAIGTAIYFGIKLDNSNKEANKNEEITENNQLGDKLNQDSEEVQSLYKKVKFVISDVDIKSSEMFSKDKVLARDLSDNTRLLMAVAYEGLDLIKNGPGLLMDNDDLSYPNYIRYIEEKDIINAFNKVFGTNAVYHKVNNLPICEEYEYESRDNRYVTYEGGCGDFVDIVFYEDIISAEKYSDRIEITTGVAYCDLYENACYKDYERKEEIKNVANNEDFKIKDYLNDINKYKYVFTKDSSDSDYYFYSIEKVK